jgi:hypothetical protein
MQLIKDNNIKQRKGSSIKEETSEHDEESKE